MFKEGDWIIHNGDWINNVLGFVEKVGQLTSVVTLVLNLRDSKVSYRQIQAMNSNLTPVPENIIEYSEESIASLVNLALDTNDEEWFHTLTSGIKI